ncbi:hypothetical protein [Lichenicoccus sp.]|uniref:hypothetical protein n=1 Tax=Lichenicoccus sp. TaxID=2781899 RepID=UPI003D0DFAF0
MRGVYRLGVLGTLWGMAALFDASAIAVTLLAAGLAGVGLFSLGRCDRLRDAPDARA